MQNRDIALNCFMAGVRAADPSDALLRAIQDHPVDLNHSGKTILIAAGKAAIAMMQTGLPIFNPDSAIAVTNYENLQELDNCIVLGASHPTPDIQGLKAAHAIAAKLKDAGENDRVILLLSGGASALLPAPVPQISFESKIKVNELLLASGLPISDVNTIRKSLSVLKGGGFASLAYPAPVTSYILSDIPNDNLTDVASGPTVHDPLCVARAIDVLKHHNLWGQLPTDASDYLTTSPAKQSRAATNHLIAGNSVSVQAMVDNVTSEFVVVKQDAPLVGDVKDASKQIANLMMQADLTQKTMFLWGGETTVVLNGSGRGGRNQELALRVAVELENKLGDCDWGFLSGGTDGIDGPTDAAGAYVDEITLKHLKSENIEIRTELENNNSYPALEKISGLIKIGATGTNVADLQIGIVCPKTK